jgi:hypothetical protein
MMTLPINTRLLRIESSKKFVIPGVIVPKLLEALLAPDLDDAKRCNNYLAAVTITGIKAGDSAVTPSS